ncbi:hypothetical protein D8I24_3261 (plasmid) [Cupriavidus necator H850]|uniref:alpha/beta fold hydrolase n=1 Tax=Cupriavidus necator TaxID=106590 RepID=UPI0020BD7172|nr:alpha/beta fold hydrolase [Cupriavidus necator]KAI3602710.1 hypothetical protein D8I24_3261 [Cupriavidus necator H850]
MIVQCGDIDVAYARHGEGEPVVLVHGLAEDRTSWVDVQTSLKSYATYAYDLRGHGETTLGNPAGTLEQLGEDLINFLEEVTGPATCVGYSLGGVIVLWVAATRPDLVRHAVVAGTSSVVGKAAVGFFEARIRSLTGNRSAFEADFRSDNAAQLVNCTDRLDEVYSRRLKAVGRGDGYVNAARAMIALANSALTPTLAKIQCAVDIVSARQDAFCPPKAADILRQAMPHATHREIDNAGHLMSVDQPAAYARAIKESLGAD